MQPAVCAKWVTAHDSTYILAIGGSSVLLYGSNFLVASENQSSNILGGSYTGCSILITYNWITHGSI